MSAFLSNWSLHYIKNLMTGFETHKEPISQTRTYFYVGTCLL